MRLIDPDIPESELVNAGGGKSGGSTPKRCRPPLHRTLSDESLSSGGAALFARSTGAAGANNLGTPPRHSAINIHPNAYSSSSSDAVFTAKPAQIVSPRNLRDERPPLTTSSSSDRLYPHTTKASSLPHASAAPSSGGLPASSFSQVTPSQSLTHVSASLGAAGPPGRQSATSTASAASTTSSNNQASSASPAFPLPEAAAGNIEWNNLVDAANRVMRDSDIDFSASGALTPSSSSLEGLNCVGAAAAAGPAKPARDPAAVSNSASLHSSIAAAVAAAGMTSSDIGAQSSQGNELARQLQELQQQLQRERLGRANLEEEVNHLRFDNERLAEESETAAAQLRKFTEWVFTTIDKS